MSEHIGRWRMGMSRSANLFDNRLHMHVNPITVWRDFHRQTLHAMEFSHA